PPPTRRARTPSRTKKRRACARSATSGKSKRSSAAQRGRPRPQPVQWVTGQVATTEQLNPQLVSRTVAAATLLNSLALRLCSVSRCRVSLLTTLLFMCLSSLRRELYHRSIGPATQEHSAYVPLLVASPARRRRRATCARAAAPTPSR